MLFKKQNLGTDGPHYDWAIITSAAAAAAKSLQSCPTLCDPIDGSPSGSTVPGILQARTLEWVAISFANAWKWKVKVRSLSCVWLLATLQILPKKELGNIYIYTHTHNNVYIYLYLFLYLFVYILS